jgi:hypothetical protein
VYDVEDEVPSKDASAVKVYAPEVVAVPETVDPLAVKKLGSDPKLKDTFSLVAPTTES